MAEPLHPVEAASGPSGRPPPELDRGAVQRRTLGVLMVSQAPGQRRGVLGDRPERPPRLRHPRRRPTRRHRVRHAHIRRRRFERRPLPADGGPGPPARPPARLHPGRGRGDRRPRRRPAPPAAPLRCGDVPVRRGPVGQPPVQVRGRRPGRTRASRPGPSARSSGSAPSGAVLGPTIGAPATPSARPSGSAVRRRLSLLGGLLRHRRGHRGVALRPDPLVVAGLLRAQPTPCARLTPRARRAFRARRPAPAASPPRRPASPLGPAVAASPRARLALAAIVGSQTAMIAVMTMTPSAHAGPRSRDALALRHRLPHRRDVRLSPIVGRLADRLGRARAIGVGGVILGIGTVVAVLAGYHPALDVRRPVPARPGLELRADRRQRPAHRVGAGRRPGPGPGLGRPAHEPQRWHRGVRRPGSSRPASGSTCWPTSPRWSRRPWWWRR